MPICNEQVSTVFAGLRATVESLIAAGGSRLFDVYLLSDTSDPTIRTAELAAWAELREAIGRDWQNAYADFATGLKRDLAAIKDRHQREAAIAEMRKVLKSYTAHREKHRK